MNLIEQLKIEETKLMEKISNTENDGTYKNLIRNLSDVTQLRQREEREFSIKQWELKWSKYETKEKDSKVSIPMISVWEQKGDEVRNTRVFEIAREVEYKGYELYFNADKNRDDKLACDIFFDKKTYRVLGDADIIGRYIKELIGDKKVIAYGDGRGFGMIVIDKLISMGINVKKENVEIHNQFNHTHSMNLGIRINP